MYLKRKKRLFRLLKIEVGSLRPEVGSRKSEIGSQFGFKECIIYVR